MQSDDDHELSREFLYGASPKLKYIDVSHNIFSWLEITGKRQPSL